MQGKLVEIPEFGMADVHLIEDQVQFKKTFLKGRIRGLKTAGMCDEDINVTVQPEREEIKRLNKIAVRLRLQIDRMRMEADGIKRNTPEEDYKELRRKLDPQLRKLAKLLEKTPEHAFVQGQAETFQLKKLREAIRVMDAHYNGKTGFGVCL